MALPGLLSKTLTAVATGAVGAVAYDALRKAWDKAPVHEAAVTATTWGLRGMRRAEEGAERARLKYADVVAEARDRIGEEVPPPAAELEHDHEH